MGACILFFIFSWRLQCSVFLSLSISVLIWSMYLFVLFRIPLPTLSPYLCLFLFLSVYLSIYLTYPIFKKFNLFPHKYPNTSFFFFFFFSCFYFSGLSAICLGRHLNAHGIKRTITSKIPLKQRTKSPSKYFCLFRPPQIRQQSTYTIPSFFLFD